MLALTPTPDLAPDLLANSLQRTNNVWRVALGQVLVQFSLTSFQWSLISIVRSEPGILVAQLGQDLGIGSIALTAELDTLEVLSWIERLPVPADRKVKRVFLDERVSARLPPIDEAISNLQRSVSRALSATELKSLVQLLELNIRGVHSALATHAGL